MIPHPLQQRFIQQFNTTPLIVRSPGRINLLGEHTDYNQGCVLPAAIDKAAWVAISKRSDKRIVLHAVQFNETIDAAIDDLKPVKSWADYPLGVAHQFVKCGYPVGGFNLMVSGDVPVGAGLSSSAAVECAVAFAIRELYKLKVSKLDLALMAQQAEHEFAGTKCGIMDQVASLFSKPDQVIRLDCRTLAIQYVPFHFPDARLVLFDTGVRHTLATSEYNSRKKECEEGVMLIQKKYSCVTSLRDATHAMIDECIPVDTLIYKRCRYVLEENVRVEKACDYLITSDVISLGRLMFETHDGLSGLYEVSCPELDFLVNQVRNDTRVFGARMMGGGFGGCTLNLIEHGQVDRVIRAVSKAYHQEVGKELAVYPVKLSEGTSIANV